MAHHVEPMDIDSDFDNKENSLHHNNVLPFTEKGYEELDVSELNMKLRYSVTPASSPMSKSYTANCLDNRSLDSCDDSLNVTVNENLNLTRSLNSTMTKNDNIVKSLKVMPLQTIPTEQYTDSNRNTSLLRPIESAAASDNANITVKVSSPSDIDENSLPSSSSSALHTPEATTPTKDPIPPKDGGSPIMRGLKSVLNMFRSSQSPIPPVESENVVKPAVLSPVVEASSSQEVNTQVLASTPISTHRKKEMSPTKRNSPQKENTIIFNEDLEKELQWKDETTIIFSQERIPIHKLLFQPPQERNNVNKSVSEALKQDIDELNSTVEYMDISYNDSIRDKTMTEIQTDGKVADNTFTGESDGEFVDCETTFTKNETKVIDDDKTLIGDVLHDLDTTVEKSNKNESGSRLKQIILDTTQDILDATLSVRPEDLLPEDFDQTKDMSALVFDKTETIQTPNETLTLDFNESMSDQRLDITSPVTSEIKIEDPNITKSTDETSSTLPTDQTFDVTKSAENLEFFKDNLNTTEVLVKADNQTFDITNLLPSRESHIENFDATIEVMSTTQPIDQKFDVLQNSESIKQNHDTTKTIEVNLTPQKESLDIIESTTQTFDEVNLETQKEDLNVSKDIENSLVQTQTLEYQPLENQSLDNQPLETHTLENQPLETPTFENQPLENQPLQSQSLDNQPLENQLLQNQILQNLNVANETVTVDNKTVDDTKINDNEAKILLPNLEIEENISAPIDSTCTFSNSAVNTSGPITSEETIGRLPIPENIKVTVKETPMTDLPVDIPLPDDDLDDEFNIPIDIANEIMGPPKSLPLDLVDNINVSPDITVTIDSELEKAGVTLTEDVVKDENILPEVCAPINNCIYEGGDNNQIPTLKLTEVPNKIQDSVEIHGSKEFDIPVESPNLDLLPEVSPSNTVDDSCEKNTSENAIDSTIAAEVEHNRIENKVVPMDINESVCELQPLPDIINQTITTSSDENIDLPSQIPEPQILNQDEFKQDIVHNTITEIPIPEVLTDIKDEFQRVTNTNATEDLELNIASKIIAESSDTPNAHLIHTETIMEDITPIADVTKTDCIKPEANIVIAAETIVEANDNPPLVEETKDHTESKVIDEEILASENNSPFISVSAEDITEIKLEGNPDIGNVEEPLTATTKVVITPPSSPPIRSKGYNFNFDDLEFDPFATKTKIRISPEFDSPNKSAEPKAPVKLTDKPLPRKDNNRRKSQPERKRPVAPKRKFNATFDGKMNDKIIDKPVDKIETTPVDMHLDAPPTIALDPSNVTIQEKESHVTVDLAKELKVEPEEKNLSEQKLEDNIEKSIGSSTETEPVVECNQNESKATPSSSEQSVYFSAGTSSNESSIPLKNVFNLPEIDDINFNPFATKSKMRQSPPPSLDVENPFATKSKIRSSPDSSIVIQKDDAQSVSFEDKIETEPMEKDVSSNLSNTTVSSKTTTVHTEDEDTVEGPFLEAEDAGPDNKISDVDGDNIDMIQFNELQTQNNEDNADSGELFIDAEAFEFLLNQNKSNTVVDSGKESLFLKFDPLFAKRMSAVTSDGVVASLAKLQKRQSTPTKSTQTPPSNMPSPIAGPSNINVTHDMDISEEYNDDLNITVSKPMMVVPPAVNPVTPRNKSLTPNRSNRRSITFTSPAMAVIDRLLSLSGNHSLHETTVTQVSREQNEADIALSQLRELLAEKEISVYNLRSESNQLRDRLCSLENHVKNLEAEGQSRLQKINQLNDTLAEKTKINKSMAAVVEEYERTIASLIAETAQDKKKHAEERIKLINERDEQTAHLASMEVSFSDLHSKYEKSKQVILNCKANEDTYKKSIKEFEENLTKMQNNYELLKQHATSKLNHANQELEKMNRAHEAEVLKLNAMIKRKELHITSLEESLVQKTKANEELTAICDELINKVG